MIVGVVLDCVEAIVDVFDGITTDVVESEVGFSTIVTEFVVDETTFVVAVTGDTIATGVVVDDCVTGIGVFGSIDVCDVVVALVVVAVVIVVCCVDFVVAAVELRQNCAQNHSVFRLANIVSTSVRLPADHKRKS
jgi:hypothetical protein